MTAYASSVTALRPLDMPAMLKEAGLTAFIMVALAFSLVGFEVRTSPTTVSVVGTRID